MEGGGRKVKRIKKRFCFMICRAFKSVVKAACQRVSTLEPILGVMFVRTPAPGTDSPPPSQGSPSGRRRL